MLFDLYTVSDMPKYQIIDNVIYRLRFKKFGRQAQSSSRNEHFRSDFLNTLVIAMISSTDLAFWITLWNVYELAELCELNCPW